MDDDKIAYWVSVTLGALALIVLVTNIIMIGSNRDLQNDVSVRQSKINTAMQISQLNQGLVQALADASLKDDDKDIRDLLASQGITVKAKSEEALKKK